MKSKLFESISTKDTVTDNGALTHSTSLNPIVDLFFLAGACRSETEEKILIKIQTAFSHNPELTLKLIFWAGDIRGGAGERRFFRIGLKFLDKYYPDILTKLIGLVPFYNRWDSLFELKNPAIFKLVYDALNNGDALCAKWMPRRKQYNNFAARFRAVSGPVLGKPKRYRETIVRLSKTLEQQMTKKDWSNIVYEHVPSVAMNKYRTAFYRNDEARFIKYIEQVTSGEKKINASAIFPHDIYLSLVKSYSTTLNKAIDAQWNALPNYLEDSNERILPVCDVSGSMDSPKGLPAAISISLGIYISQHNKSIFKDGFITFSTKPKLQILKGTFSEKVRQFDRGFAEDTNLQAVFNLILERAMQENLSQEDMPTKLLIISDMQFDNACEGETNFEAMKRKYKNSGYKIPQIIFWNVNGKAGNLPVTINDKGVALVSGASPTLLKSILGGNISPESVMLKTLTSERYSKVVI